MYKMSCAITKTILLNYTLFEYKNFLYMCTPYTNYNYIYKTNNKKKTKKKLKPYVCTILVGTKHKLKETDRENVM